MNARGFKQKALRLWMEIAVQGSNGSVAYVPLDITRFSSQFALNSIPQATCSVALGAFVPKTSLASNLHYILPKISYKTKAVVYMSTATGYESVPPGLNISKDTLIDNKKIVLFEGYTSGAGYRRSGSTVEYVISLEHWLSDLTASTVLSPDLAPGTPFNLFFPATGAAETEPNSAGGFNQTLAAQTILIQNAIKDLWQGGIRPYFAKLANLNALGSSSQNYLGIGELGELANNVFQSAKNDLAISALNRFLAPGNNYYLPLSLRDTDNTRETVTNIIESLQNTSETTFDGTTFWDNLVTLGSTYLFNIVPMINKAAITPRLPSYRKARINISSAEITGFDISTSMPRFIGGVVLTTSGGEMSGFNNLGAETQDAGFYQYFSTGMFFSGKPGTIIMQRAPQWLSQPMPSNSEAIENDLILKQGGPRAPVNIRVKQKAIAHMRIADAYAKLVYANEVLKFRNGTLSGKLRLDIAPGTIARIETAGESVIAGDGFSYPLYAHIDQVNTSVDAVSSQASTSFVLSSVRSEVENADNELVIDANPLYNTVWNGSPMYV